MIYEMERDLPSIRMLTAFAAVVRSGSVQSAAAELNVTQPAISQAVKQLEDHVGVPLLDRGHRPARPTEAGLALAAAITDGLDRIGGAIETLRQDSPRRETTVTVACSVGVATYWLMPRLPAFYEAHPSFLVNVITTQSGAPALTEGIDVAIRYGHGRWSDGLVRHLFDEVIEPVCAPGVRARFDGPVPPGHVSLLHVKTTDPSWVTWTEYLRRTGLPAQRGSGQTFTNYVQTTQAALDGLGMMLGWRSITGELVAAGQLVSAGLPPLQPRDGFHLVMRNKRRGEATERFAHWLLTRSLAEYGDRR